MAWTRLRERLRAEGRSYVDRILSEILEPVDLVGDTLRLRARDAFALEWVRSQCGELIAEGLAVDGLAVQVTAASEAA